MNNKKHMKAIIQQKIELIQRNRTDMVRGLKHAIKSASDYVDAHNQLTHFASTEQDSEASVARYEAASLIDKLTPLIREFDRYQNQIHALNDMLNEPKS